tara:strand:+ start:259 stop:423 length:165 start_codon:yes stop_codon:yes gene_type:complete
MLEAAEEEPTMVEELQEELVAEEMDLANQEQTDSAAEAAEDLTTHRVALAETVL